MNYRTTAVLLVILAALGAYMFLSGDTPENAKKIQTDDLQVLDLDEAAVESLEVRADGAAVLVKREAAGKWELAKPEQNEADQMRIDGVVYTISKLQAARVVTANPDDLSAYGLSKPAVEVIIGMTGSAPTGLLMGSQNPAGTGSYVKRTDSSTVYLVGTYSLDQLRGLVDDPPKAKPTATPLPEPTPTPGP